MKASLIAELVQAGTDEDGQPRLVIHATEEELKKLKPSPLYCQANITFEWESETPEATYPPMTVEDVPTREELLKDRAELREAVSQLLAICQELDNGQSGDAEGQFGRYQRLIEDAMASALRKLGSWF